MVNALLPKKRTGAHRTRKTIKSTTSWQRPPTESDVKAELKQAKKFSPIGTFPPDFGEWFEIKETKLGDENMDGVFATVNLPANMFLGQYRGKRSYRDVGKGRKKFKMGQGRYVVEHRVGNKFRYIDGEDEDKSSWLRYINRPETKGQENAMFVVELDNQVYVRTTKEIKKGQQVFIWYLLNGELDWDEVEEPGE